jgi:diguanylate cyclase (GGDEF)-like protein
MLNFAKSCSVPRLRPVQLLTACGLVLMVAIAAGTGVMVLKFREQAIADSQRELKNTALILAEETGRAFQALELVQMSMVERIRSLGVLSKEELAHRMSDQGTYLALKDKISGLPNIDAITIIDPDGKLINFSRYWPIPAVNVSDRDYFKALKSDPKLQSFVSEPVRNRGTGTWTIYRAQKIVAPNGEFLGMILGAMELQYFETFFGKIALDPGSSISLFRRDGILLARYPRVDPLIGGTFKEALFKKLLANAHQGAGRQIGIVDGKERIIAANAVSGYPLAVVATTTLSGALTKWTRQTKVLIGSAGLCALVIGITLLLIGRQQLQAHRRATQALEKQKLQLDAAINNMPQGLVMLDAAERLILCNDRYIEMYGLSRAVVRPGCTLKELLEYRGATGGSPKKLKQYRADLLTQLATVKGTVRIVETTDDREILISNQPTLDGGWVITHDDVTEQRKAEAKLSHMAMHDALTGLPNRVSIREQIESCLWDVRPGERVAVLFLDLDRFKNVNDSLGHAYGDELLCQACDRLQACLQKGDIVARLGDDEFVVLQRRADKPTDSSKLASRLIDSINAPFNLSGDQVIVGTSIGIALASVDAIGADQLLKNANMALHRAKLDGGNTYRFFEPEMDELIRSRQAIERDLRSALANEEFELYYQPIVNIRSERICAFEALLRWNHPERGVISPAEFIPIAEETGLIIPIGEWVLLQACLEAMKWPNDIRVAINLSPVQFRAPDLHQVVSNVLVRSGLEATRLELEITESALLLENEKTLSTLHQLRKLGARLSMDDFGTGYSSLCYLRSFPFNKIKIDKSFVHDLSQNEDAMAIIRAVASLGNSLGITTTGEGVETQIELDYLRQEGCTEAQGYLFSKPVRPEEISRIQLMRRSSPSLQPDLGSLGAIPSSFTSLTGF